MIHAIQLTLREGGLTLYALLLLAAAIYAIMFGVWRQLSSALKQIEEKKWLNAAPVEKSLPWQKTAPNPRELQRSFASFELDELAWIERRIPFLAVLITSAPLLGLLGTVAGMLVTFAGMAKGSQAPIDTIATGISTALVTTQAGLVIAIPAAFLLALIKRQSDIARLRLQAQLHARLAGIESSNQPTFS
jgi:biopolymer transport protein ExbB